jgi:glycosyltransferase involved in cell wall biosynthesis
LIRISSAEGTAEHRVITTYSEVGGEYVYADELRRLGALSGQQGASGARRIALRVAKSLGRSRSATPLRLVRSLVSLAKVPAGLRVAKEFRPQVVHSHTAPDFPVALMLSRLLRLPLVHTVPSLFSQLRNAGYGWMPWLYARAHRWVDYFSTGEGRSELISIGIPPEKILYDLAGVDFTAVDSLMIEAEALGSQIRTQQSIPEQAPVAVSIGRLYRTKGYDLGLDALKLALEAVGDLHWIVVGEGEERENLEQKAAELGIDKNVHFVGFSQNPLRFCTAADLFWRTTVFEPENLSFYESMAMALPAVGFETAEGRDLLGTVGHGFKVLAGDVNAFARASVELLNLPDRGRELGRRAAAYAREHLDIARSVGLLTKVYSELARRGERNDGTASS